MSKPDVQDLRCLVIKIGSSLLIDADDRLDRGWLDALADDIAALRADGRQVIVVSSGAVALGAPSAAPLRDASLSTNLFTTR